MRHNFRICSALIVMLTSAPAVGQTPLQSPVGQPTTFDSGVDGAGHKTYVIHGYMDVSFLNQKTDVKVFSGALPAPSNMGKTFNQLQAQISITSFSSGDKSAYYKVVDITPAASGVINFKIAVKGSGEVHQIAYTIYLSTEAMFEKSEVIDHHKDKLFVPVTASTGIYNANSPVCKQLGFDNVMYILVGGATVVTPATTALLPNGVPSYTGMVCFN